MFIVDSKTLQLLGALGFPFFSGRTGRSSVASDSDSDVESNCPFGKAPFFGRDPTGSWHQLLIPFPISADQAHEPLALALVT